MYSSDRFRYAAMLLVVLALITAVALTCQENNETGMVGSGPMIDSVLSADSILIQYEVHGQGEPALVFVHCWSCDRSYWENQVSDLSRDFTVVTLDLAGHGASGMGREVWSVEAFGGDVVAVIDKLGLEEIILIGHSMGGPVSIAAARELPGQVKAIIGVDNLQDLGQQIAPEQIDQWLVPFRADFATTTEAFVRGMFPETADTALVGMVARDLAAAPPEVALGAFEQLFGYNLAEAVADLPVPIRCINSDRYPTNIEGNQAVAASYEVTFMPGYGHFPHMEDSQAFNRVLRNILAEFFPTAEQQL
jgi:pimeloyl-ACP methyl ester carboxylesterase